jgi:hypothetical protein
MADLVRLLGTEGEPLPGGQGEGQGTQADRPGP